MSQQMIAPEIDTTHVHLLAPPIAAPFTPLENAGLPAGGIRPNLIKAEIFCLLMPKLCAFIGSAAGDCRPKNSGKSQAGGKITKVVEKFLQSTIAHHAVYVLQSKCIAGAFIACPRQPRYMRQMNRLTV